MKVQVFDSSEGQSGLGTLRANQPTLFMTVNASARRYRIWVCRPSETDVSGCLELTDFCIGDSSGFLSVTDEPIGEDGLLRTTGDLVFTPPEEIVRTEYSNLVSFS
ncbi:hypothetical protein IFO70_27630 [Phormidium tenue FACHB-886]|nr:hypothetical protein [Phormidium tenue FACHB-886]